jgi:hypothetical protein
MMDTKIRNFSRYPISRSKSLYPRVVLTVG